MNNADTQTLADDQSPLGLIVPNGVDIYTDLDRGKRFVRLSYRRRDVTRARALAFVGEVIDDVTQAGLIITDTVKTQFTLGQGDGKCGIFVEVAVKPVAEQAQEDAAWAAELRQRYGTKG